MRVGRFLVDFNGLQHLNRLIVITQQGVHTQQTNKREVAEHLVKAKLAEVAGHSLWIDALRDGLQLLLNVGDIDQRVQYIQNTQNAPHVAMIHAQLLNLILRLVRQTCTVENSL